MTQFTLKKIMLSYHSKMFLWHKKQVKKHTKKMFEILAKKTKVEKRQDGLNIERTIIDEIHPANAYERGQK